MTVDPARTNDGAGKLRILEINTSLFRVAAPDQTDFHWAARKPDGQLKRLFGPAAFFRALKKLRSGGYDLVVVDGAPLPAWHPRTWLTALRDYHIRAPQALFAIAAARLLHHFHSVPVAVIDVNDSFGIGRHNFGLIDRCHSYFKRELTADRWQVFFKSSHWDLPGRRWRSQKSAQRRMAKLKPIHLGYPSQPTIEPTTEKTSDVFFAGDLWPNSTVRTDGIKELLALRDEGYVIDVPDQPLDRKAFHQRLAAARLAWSPMGYGWDCYRHYESSELGTVPLMNYPTILQHRPFREGEHCFYYSVEPGGLSRAVRAALKDPARLAEMAIEARAYTLTHHTARARAEYVVATVLGKKLDGSLAGAE
ncbi:hypothetical protein K32_29850 [Kaistia sp. 32K]|uniref:glycosyltransferase family protein n=1 Tax=Kaistia sp. 32K TaxID=2795690 RepID=UPI00191515A6|nr:glycosyltransferase [Kaistia sp. 32K]BCP54368.1 hypothetical protein K32_29850 [Kaistia sp. 32K]